MIVIKHLFLVLHLNELILLNDNDIYYKHKLMYDVLHHDVLLQCLESRKC